MTAYTLYVWQRKEWVRMATGLDLGRIARLIRNTFEGDTVRVKEGSTVIYEGPSAKIPWENTGVLITTPRLYIPPPEEEPKSKVPVVQEPLEEEIPCTLPTGVVPS
jgi:hypothetical protein